MPGSREDEVTDHGQLAPAGVQGAVSQQSTESGSRIEQPSAPAFDVMKLLIVFQAAQLAAATIVASLLLIVAYQLNTLRDDIAATKSLMQINTVAVARIAESDVLKLDAVQMQGSSTWTLPVSSIRWSGQ